MSRRWIRWPLGVVAVAVVAYLAVWGATVFLGARLVPAAWLPTSERIVVSTSHEVTVADGWQAGHSWSLTSHVTDEQQCLQSYVDGITNVQGCTSLRAPAFRARSTELPGSGYYLTFGAVPDRVEQVELSYPNGANWRVRVLRHPEVPTPFFYAVAAQPGYPLGLEVRYIDAQGHEVQG